MHGLVYKDFDRARHVTTELPKTRKERILGVDFGFTNPTAVLTIDKDHEGTYWITSEWYKPGKINIEVIEYAKPLASNAVYPDPAEPDRIEEMRRHGLDVREVSKDIEAGISKVQELLRAGRLKVHSSCVNTIAEFESYAYPDRKPDHNEPETRSRRTTTPWTRCGTRSHEVAGRIRLRPATDRRFSSNHFFHSLGFSQTIVEIFRNAEIAHLHVQYG